MMFNFGKANKNKFQSAANSEPSDADSVTKPAGGLLGNEQDNSLLKRILFAVIALVIFIYLIGIYWSVEPDVFNVKYQQAYKSEGPNRKLIVGYTTVATAEKVTKTLLDKNGGYLSNDVIPPSIFLDNIPAWEFGVLVQIRDLVSVLRNDMSRSQSQSLENADLKQAEPLLNNDHSSWLVPRPEGVFSEAIDKLRSFREGLSDADKLDVQFYARADNLKTWLELVNKRLGGLSQRLSASVVEDRINTDLSGDSAATQSTNVYRQVLVKTPWLDIDDTFYEARGACWALIHFLKAVEIDFEAVLDKKNAKASLSQIIRELEATQESVWSPYILNGSGFGVMANHSLVMANYISRANAGLIDLKELLENG